MSVRRGRIWNVVAAFVLAALVAVGVAPVVAWADDEGVELAAQAASVSAPRVVADSSTESGQVATWDCVWFGSYPQTEVAPGDATYAQLEAASWDGNGDATVGGARYRRLAKSDATYNGDWSDDGYGSAKYRYFRYEPIKWRVLEVSGSTALVVADVALDDQCYDTNYNLYRTETWEICSVRLWLNGYDAGSNEPGIDYGTRNFLAAPFSSTERGAISTTTVINAVNTNWGTSGGNDTSDKVFLLSEAEVCDASHGFSTSTNTWDEARRCKTSDYAHAMGAWRVSGDEYDGNCEWWLRTPGDLMYYACGVDHGGSVARNGICAYSDVRSAVRPALNLNLSSSSVRPAGTVSSVGTGDSYDISRAQISSISVQSYTGDPVEPDFTVRMGLSTLLRKGVDYTVSYSDNVRVGTAKVTITGAGAYHGSVSRSFKISSDADGLFGGELDLGFGDASFTLDDDVPILGGDTFKLDFPVKLPIQTVFEDGKVKVGINLPDPYLSGSGSSAKAWEWTDERKSMKEQWEGFCKDARKTKDLFKGGYSNFLKKISDGRWKRWNVPGMSKSAEVYAAGYLEYAYGDKLSDAARLEGSVVLTVKGSATAQQQWVVWVIPVTGSITFSAEGTVTGSLAWDFANSSWTGDIELAVAIGLEPYVGVGVGQWASVGVYGSAKTGVELTVLSRTEPLGLREWYLTGEAGGRAYFAKKAFTWTIISTADLRRTRFAKYTDSSGHLRLWSKTQASLIGGNRGVALQGQASDAGVELLASAETLPATDEVPLLEAAAGGSLVDSAYPGAEPSVIEAGGTRLLVYVGQDLSRPELDQTVLYYRVYDAGSGTWGDPVPVLDDGTADCMPSVLACGDEAYVAWLDASQSFGGSEGVDVGAYMSSFSMRVARWDAGTGSFADLGRPAGDGAGYAYLAALGVGESGLVATWVENADGAAFGLSAGNGVRQATYDGTAWSDVSVLADGLNVVTSLAARGSEAAWAVDEDNDLTTTPQFVMQSAGQASSAGATSLAFVELPGVDGVVLAANIAGGLSYFDGASWVEVLPEGTMGAASSFWADGDSVYYVRVDEDASRVAVATYDDGVWGSALVTTDDGYVDSLSDPCGTIALTHTAATLREGTDVWDTTSEVRVLDAKERADVALEAADVASGDLEPGAVVPASLTITNEGTARLYAASWGAMLDDVELASGVVDVDLMPGETGTFEVELALPQDLGAGALTFRVSCDGDDSADDGECQVEVVKPDLSVSARFFEGTAGEDGDEGMAPALVVTVTNVGTASADARTTVTDEAGAVLLEENAALAAGESATYTREFGSDDDVLPADGSEVVLIAQAETDAEEFYDSNNVDYAIARRRYLDAEGEVVGPVGPTSIEGATVEAADQTYTGKALEPEITVTLGDVALVAGTDFTVAYADNVNAGTATVTVTGMGDYEGTATGTFAIAKAAQTVSASDVSVAMGKTALLGASASAGGKLTYKSKSTKIAKVDANGKVTPVKVGATTITITAAATDNYDAATATVTVTVTQGTQSITASDVTVEAGATVALGATSSAGARLTYHSSDEKVATVSDDGTVTGVAAGTAKVTIAAEGTADWRAATKDVTVTVTKASAPVVESPFVDVNSTTAHEQDILWLAQQKISEGWTRKDGKREFRPYATVARADMAAFLFRLARLWGVVDDGWQPTGGSSFADVIAKTAHYREVMWLAESGISQGWTRKDGKREFRPYATVARADMAAFLARLARLAGRGSGVEGAVGAFSDVTASTAHADDIAWLAASGVSRGWDMPDGTRQFRPLAKVARADMAAFLQRLDALG